MTTPNPTIQKADALSEWFDKVSFDVHLEKTKHEAGAMPDKLKALYTELMNGEINLLAEHSQQVANNYYRKKIALDYLDNLIKIDCNLNQLAINYNMNSVLIWSVIEDDDEQSEDCLIMLQAKLNAMYQDKGYRISTTIVEKSDPIPMPSHYREIKITEVTPDSH